MEVGILAGLVGLFFGALALTGLFGGVSHHQARVASEINNPHPSHHDGELRRTKDGLQMMRILQVLAGLIAVGLLAIATTTLVG